MRLPYAAGALSQVEQAAIDAASRSRTTSADKDLLNRCMSSSAPVDELEDAAAAFLREWPFERAPRRVAEEPAEDLA